MKTDYWFKSPKFKVLANEDKETSPLRYGKFVALCLAESFKAQGFNCKATAEDWGWRIDILNTSCPVWIGAGNIDEVDDEGNVIAPTEDNIVWHCFVNAEASF